MVIQISLYFSHIYTVVFCKCCLPEITPLSCISVIKKNIDATIDIHLNRNGVETVKRFGEGLFWFVFAGSVAGVLAALVSLVAASPANSLSAVFEVSSEHVIQKQMAINRGFGDGDGVVEVIVSRRHNVDLGW